MIHAMGGVKKYKTETVIKMVERFRSINPETNLPFTDKQLKYYDYMLYKWRCAQDSSDTEEYYKKHTKTIRSSLPDFDRNDLNSMLFWSEVARYMSTPCLYLSIEDFSDHLNESLELTDEFYRFEREKAEEVLKKSPDGCWLFRYSSLNGKQDKPYWLKIYVVSIKVGPNTIEHLLIKYDLSSGWYIYFNDGEKHYVCFLYILIDISEKYNIKYSSILQNFHSI